MPVVIPFQPSVTPYTFSTTLESAVYSFAVRWNAREDAWYFDIADQFNSPIWKGIKIMLGVVLGNRCQDSRFPPGFMVAADTSQQQLDAKFGDLGARVIVLYYSAAELAILNAGGS